MKPVARWGGPTSAALTCYMALFLVFNAFALNGMLWLSARGTVYSDTTTTPLDETVLKHTWDTLRGRGCDDSWGIMAFALDYVQSPHTTPLYTEIFFNRKLKFQYPPSSLFVIAAMLRLAGPELVRTTECQVYAVPTLNDILGWLFILMTAASTAALLEIGLRGRQALAGSGAELAARAAIIIGLTLTFYPVVKAYTLGQMQVWINGLFALALLCWVTGRRTSCGLLMGLMCLVKPHYGLFLLWAALRHEWRATAACAAAVGGGLAASVAAFGWANNVDYLQVFWFLSQHGEAYYPNQSINGLLNRLMSISDPVLYESLEFNDNGFPPFNRWVYGGVLITSCIILSAALLRRGTEGDPHRTIDFCTMALSITIASPIAWEHHYGILLPVFAVLLANSIENRGRLVLIAACYVLISNFIPATNLLAYTIWNVAQSYVFAAALVVLALLHTSRPGWQFAGAGSLAALGSLPARNRG
jgi:alpha-1,2-mannosyltransferase